MQFARSVSVSVSHSLSLVCTCAHEYNNYDVYFWIRHWLEVMRITIQTAGVILSQNSHLHHSKVAAIALKFCRDITSSLQVNSKHLQFLVFFCSLHYIMYNAAFPPVRLVSSPLTYNQRGCNCWYAALCIHGNPVSGWNGLYKNDCGSACKRSTHQIILFFF